MHDLENFSERLEPDEMDKTAQFIVVVREFGWEIYCKRGL